VTVGVLLDLGVVLALTALVPLLLIRSRAPERRPASTPDAQRLTAPATASSPAPAGRPRRLAGIVAMLTAGAGPALRCSVGCPAHRCRCGPGRRVRLGVRRAGRVPRRRGAEAFPRSPEWALRRLLRTIGMGAAGVALVAGLLRVPLGASPPAC
jgi:hypothetical protein